VVVIVLSRSGTMRLLVLFTPCDGCRIGRDSPIRVIARLRYGDAARHASQSPSIFLPVDCPNDTADDLHCSSCVFNTGRKDDAERALAAALR
jgi:hypothetical protein